jgi:hypothetical protein
MVEFWPIQQLLYYFQKYFFLRKIKHWWDIWESIVRGNEILEINKLFNIKLLSFFINKAFMLKGCFMIKIIFIPLYLQVKFGGWCQRAPNPRQMKRRKRKDFWRWENSQMDEDRCFQFLILGLGFGSQGWVFLNEQL